MSIGEKIIDEIIKQGMVKPDPQEPTVLVWSSNAEEQISALVSDRTNWLERRVTEMEQEIGAVMIGRDQSDKIAATANTEAVRYMREREDAKAALALAVKILTDSEYEWRTKLAAANASLTECAQKNAALMKAIEILKPDPDEAKEVEQMRDLLRRADRQLAGQGFGEQWPLRLAINKALSVAPYQGRFEKSEPPSSTGRCTCDGCDKTVDNAWRDSDGYHCLTCLAKQRDNYRTEATKLKTECERGTCAGAATMGAAVKGYRDNLNGVIAGLRADNERLRSGIDDALLHLHTNYDIDGNSMNDSDAADSLRKAIGAERTEPGTFRAGDHVHHKPSNENWVVACDEEGGKIMPSGWPCCLADAADCSLLKAATDAERLETLQGHAKETKDHEAERDPRTITARRQLAAAPEKGGQ